MEEKLETDEECRAKYSRNIESIVEGVKGTAAVGVVAAPNRVYVLLPDVRIGEQVFTGLYMDMALNVDGEINFCRLQQQLRPPYLRHPHVYQEGNFCTESSGRLEDLALKGKWPEAVAMATAIACTFTRRGAMSIPPGLAKCSICGKVNTSSFDPNRVSIIECGDSGCRTEVCTDHQSDICDHIRCDAHSAVFTGMDGKRHRFCKYCAKDFFGTQDVRKLARMDINICDNCGRLRKLEPTSCCGRNICASCANTARCINCGSQMCSQCYENIYQQYGRDTLCPICRSKEDERLDVLLNRAIAISMEVGTPEEIKDDKYAASRRSLCERLAVVAATMESALDHRELSQIYADIPKAATALHYVLLSIPQGMGYLAGTSLGSYVDDLLYISNGLDNGNIAYPTDYQNDVRHYRARMISIAEEIIRRYYVPPVPPVSTEV